jgi:hypothetical protein
MGDTTKGEKTSQRTRQELTEHLVMITSLRSPKHTSTRKNLIQILMLGQLMTTKPSIEPMDNQMVSTEYQEIRSLPLERLELGEKAAC